MKLKDEIKLPSVFGERFAKVLKERNVTAYRFAKDCGYTQSCIHRIKNGITNPSLRFLMTTAKYFDISIDYLLGLAD